MTAKHSEKLKLIPAVGTLLESTGGLELRNQLGEGLSRFAIRHAVESLRRQILAGIHPELPFETVIIDSARSFGSTLQQPGMRRIVNATGIVLHTGLGRSPLCDEAVIACQTFSHYSLLEVERETGERGKREYLAEELLCELTGAEAACVVNNNAAATFLALHALGDGREAVVSRGQLIEIGGNFRMPDVMVRSGALLREVGTTNRTHLHDYEGAVGPNTAILFHVHPSNFRIHGFTSSPSIQELCELGRKHSLTVIDDLGGGALVPMEDYGLQHEPLVPDSVRAGCDVVCFSGDKLISGPQCGILVGKKAAIHRVRTNPFFRMLRPDKVLLALLESTLIHYLDWPKLRQKLPLHLILGKSNDDMSGASSRVLSLLKLPSDVVAEIIDDASYVGGGASPDESLPSKAIRLSRQGDSTDSHWAETVSASLRLGLPAVLCRIKDNGLVFNMRCLLDGDEIILAEALNENLPRASKA